MFYTMYTGLQEAVRIVYVALSYIGRTLEPNTRTSPAKCLKDTCFLNSEANKPQGLIHERKRIHTVVDLRPTSVLTDRS
jgi:hypothetical protein